MSIAWTEDFTIVRAEDTRATVLAKLAASFAQWVLVRYPYGRYWHLLTRQEVEDLLPEPALQDGPATFGQILAASGHGRSKSADRWRGEVFHVLALPSGRCVQLEHGRPVAVGSLSLPLLGEQVNISLPHLDNRPREDETQALMRYPSIEPQGVVKAGQLLVLVVDLKREEDGTTLGALALIPADPAWQSLDVEAILQSPAIDFDNGGAGRLVVRRNGDTMAASISGRVHDNIPPGTVLEVKAIFMMNHRYSGSAVRRMVIQDSAARFAAQPPPQAAPAVELDGQAPSPDLTVFISIFDADEPGRLHWRMHTPGFQGGPPKMDGSINLGQGVAKEAELLFKEFANLARGQHVERIEGFGATLWQRAPVEFRTLYWALRDHYADRPLTIQFISDDPYLPWELMVPARDGAADEGPLARRHIVARWISRWQGHMINSLGAGDVIAIAPRYQSANLMRQGAQAAADVLVSRFKAQRLAGTRSAVLGLLEQPPARSVSLVHFSGHGAFSPAAASQSRIELEDGLFLAAGDIDRPKVRLGELHRTVFFLNACEVGATASVFGSVGGWADAFLARKFGGFIGPLWAVEDDDARIATEFLMPLIVEQRLPIAQALQILREQHGTTSPTFHSYLFYGDVRARLGETRAPT